MAFFKLLCKSSSWLRRPTETVSEIKSQWRYVTRERLGSRLTFASFFIQAIWKCCPGLDAR
jgi:hypothetical protein